MNHTLNPDCTEINTLIEQAAAGDRFEFEDGDYFLSEPLRITDKQQLSLSAAPGAKVHLHGGIRIHQWQQEAPGLWSASIPSWSCELYCDGVRQELARWPKERPEALPRSYSRSTGTTPTEIRKRSFLFDRSEFPELADGEQMSAFLWPTGSQGVYNWHSVFLPCEMHGNQISLDRDTWFPLGNGTRFFLLNHPAFLTEESEFYIDRKQLKLFFRPPGGSPAGKCIVLPMMKNLVEIRNSSGIELDGLTLTETDRSEFNDGEILDQDDALVLVTENSSNIHIRNCTLNNSGLNGVCMYQRAQRVTVEGCHIFNIGHTGVRAYGDWVSEEYMNRGHLIRNNHIHHVGRRIGQSAGVQIMQSGENCIANNLIHHSARYAISLLAPNTRTFVKPAFFPDRSEVPSFMAKWFTYVRDNLVYRNEVFACNLDSQDTGLIQGFRSGEGNVVSDNIVRDSELPFSFGNGIYLDDCCDGWTVKNNLVYNLNHHGEGTLYDVLTFKGIGNRALNNRFLHNNVGTSGVVDTFSMGGKENYNLEVSHNIMHENGSGLYGNSDWQPRRFRQADHNLFFESKVPYHICGGLGKDGNIPLYQWQRAGFDRHSLCAHPQFMNEDQHDYRLQFSSPAFGLGITEIEYAAIGLLESYSQEVPQPDRLQRLYVEVFRGEEEISKHRSWVDCHCGEKLSFRWRGRDSQLLLVSGLRPQLSLLSGNRNGIEFHPDGVLLSSEGCYRVKAELNGAECLLDLLVDDRMESLRWASIPPQVVQGERYPAGVVARTRLGREVPIAHPEFESLQGLSLIQDQLYITGSERGIARVSVEGLRQDLEIHIVPDLILDLEPETARLATVGVPQTFRVTARMNSGRQMRVEDVEILAEEVDISGNTLTLPRVGEQKLLFQKDGVSTEYYVRAVPNLPLPTGFRFSQYGLEEGKAMRREDGILEIYSNANNVWYDADDASFLHQQLPSEGLQVELCVHEIERTHHFAQNGILVKAEDTAESPCVHFRVDTEGELMVALRTEHAGKMLPEFGASPWAKFGGGDANMDDRLSDGVCFPVQLRLDYREGQFRFYFKKQENWELLGELRMPLPERCYAGAASFAVDKDHIGRTRFELSLHQARLSAPLS